MNFKINTYLNSSSNQVHFRTFDLKTQVHKNYKVLEIYKTIKANEVVEINEVIRNHKVIKIYELVKANN